MGTVYAEIKLSNLGDINIVERGYAPAESVRSLTLKAVVDTGAMRLVINDEVLEKLGLNIAQEASAELADGTIQKCRVTEDIKLEWKDRTTTVKALVLPDAREVLLGVVPLEDLDLTVDPVHQILTGAHGDKPLWMIR